MKKYKILVIDDERLIVKTTSLALQYMGFATLECLDGESGLLVAASENPDLILLDLQMPGLSGWDVLMRLQVYPETAKIPVIIFTAREFSKREEGFGSASVVGFLGKPFEPDDLTEIIQAVLEKK